jgi:hypothetical protein
MISAQRQEILRLLERLSELSPDVRFERQGPRREPILAVNHRSTETSSVGAGTHC